MGQSFSQDIQKAFKDNLVYIIGTSIGCVFVTILTFSPGFFQSDEEVESKGKATSAIDKAASARVNKNLQSDQSLLDLRAKKVAADNERIQAASAPSFDPSLLYDQDYEMIDPSVHDGSEDVYEDIFGDSAMYDTHLNPSQRIEAKLQTMRMLDRYDYQQKLVFVETFVQNAYEQGYQVEINEDLEVVRIKKVNNKQPYRGTATLDKLFDRQGL